MSFIRYMKAEMSDAKLRGQLLSHFYDLRHRNGGLVPVNSLVVVGLVHVSDDVIAGVCRQLASAGLIEWTGYLGGPVIGSARITALGVDAVERASTPGISIHYPGTATTPSNATTPAEETPIAPTTLTAPPAEVQSRELFTLKPTLWGMSIDLREAYRRLSHWWKEPR